MRSRVAKASERVRDSSCSHRQESHKKTKLHNCHINAEGLSQSLAGSLAVTSGSVSMNESRFVDSVGFLLVSLTLQVLPFFCRIPQVPSNVWLWVCICFHQLLDETSLMTIGLDTNL